MHDTDLAITRAGQARGHARIRDRTAVAVSARDAGDAEAFPLSGRRLRIAQAASAVDLPKSKTAE
jgi:hypothetical protein